MSEQERGSRPTKVPQWTDVILEAIKYIPSECLQDLAAVWRRGDERYGYENWKKGLPYKEALDHVFEHIRQYIADGPYNTEDRLPHLMQAAWGLITVHYMDQHQKLYAHFDNLHPHLVRHPDKPVDDRPEVRNPGQQANRGLDDRPSSISLSPVSDHSLEARLLDALSRDSPFGSRRWPLDYLAVDVGFIVHQHQLTNGIKEQILNTLIQWSQKNRDRDIIKTENSTGEIFLELR